VERVPSEAYTGYGERGTEADRRVGRIFIQSQYMNLPSKETNIWQRILIIYVGIALLAGSFYGGSVFGYRRGVRAAVPPGSGTVLNIDQTSPAYLAKDVDFALYWRVWNLLKERYLHRPVSDTQLFYGSLKGMVAAIGDDYTTFFDPETTSQFNSDLAGKFQGIGAEIGIRDEKLVVIAPLPETPASRAGLATGDQIVAIDGTNTTGMAVEQAVRLIRGKAGTAVKLTIMRKDFEKPKDFSLTRSEITIKSVHAELRNDGVAVIAIYEYGNDTVLDFKRAILDLIPKEPKGLVIDMRGNPGGYLDGAIAVAGEWIPKDQIVVIEQDSKRTEFRSEGPTRLAGIPTVILVNGGTASAAEIVSGALQDYKIAKLVGTKTFGKGSVQDFHQFEDGSALKYTIAEWLTPLGRSINKNGIVPDEVVEVKEEDVKAGRDPQMERALEMLKK